jgi:hydroxyacylglutathione hydrolase
VLLLEDEAAYRQVVFSLARVGIENVVGYLAEDLAVWESLGLPLASGDIEDIYPEDLIALLEGENEDRPVVLDVREPWEFHQGHVPGAVSIPLGQLAYKVGELDLDRPVAVICETGHRSQSAAALLGQKNFKKIYNVATGTSGWARQGFPLER